ncbi:MAG: tyrosine-type recombinase/integrase [Actinomycetota bacterium]|nr:tyrosine-type recombinase/integrase [Actinomycetota bacterium]
MLRRPSGSACTSPSSARPVYDRANQYAVPPGMTSQSCGNTGVSVLRFHDLRHTFATTMIGRTSIRRVQVWMGHSDLHSTMRYLHYAPRDDDA